MSGGGADKVEKTPEEKELARIGKEQWFDYKSRFVPIENAYIDEVQSWGSPEERDKIVGEAAVLSRRGQPQVVPMEAGGGVGSGQHFTGTVDAGIEGGMGSASTSTDASLASKNRETAGLQRLIGVGRGIKDTASGGLTRTAAVKGAEEIESSRASNLEQRNKMSGYGQALGLAGGIGYHGYKKGWFDRAPTPAPTPKHVTPASMAGYSRPS